VVRYSGRDIQQQHRAALAVQLGHLNHGDVTQCVVSARTAHQHLLYQPALQVMASLLAAHVTHLLSLIMTGLNLTMTSYAAALVKALPFVLLRVTVTVELLAFPGSTSAAQISSAQHISIILCGTNDKPLTKGVLFQEHSSKCLAVRFMQHGHRQIACCSCVESVH
jgi:hypothetical protein